MPGLYDADGRMRVNPSTGGVDGSPLTTQEAPATTGATTSVASAVAPTLLRASNTARKGLVVSNDSTSILYILLGTGIVSATNYTYAMAAKGTVASSLNIAGFTGAVNGIWEAANGSAKVTELS